MRGFLDELRRRKVTKTAALYAVVAWVVIEASSVILPALQLPEWTVTFIVIAIIAAHRRGDIEPMIEELPSRFRRDDWNLATVQR